MKRFSRFLDNTGLTVTEFCKRLNNKIPETRVYQWRSKGFKTNKMEWIAMIEDEFDCTVKDLI